MADFSLFDPGEKRVGVIIGTGPSLTDDQVHKTKCFRQFGANRAFQFDIDVVVGVNWEFWRMCWDEIKHYRCHKWATRDQDKTSHLDGLRFIPTKWMPGLSRDKRYIADHHGSGPQAVNLAYHYGCEVMLLIGWDMRYPGKVNRYHYTQKRHFYGDDDVSGKHFPNTGPGGEFTSIDGKTGGLIGEMATINPKDYGIEIINCTPNSAMKCFPMMDLDEAVAKYG